MPSSPAAPVLLPLTLHPSRARAWGLLAGCLGSIPFGILMIHRGEWRGGGLCVGLFGLCLPVAVSRLLPGVSFLELRADGFTFRSLLGKRTVPWRAVRRFGVVHVGRHPVVAWSHVAGYVVNPGYGHFVEPVVGFEGGLPDTYGLTPAALVDLLERMRARTCGPDDQARHETS